MSDGRRRPRRKQERKRLDRKIWKEAGMMAGRRETEGKGAVQEKDKAERGGKGREVEREEMKGKRRLQKGGRQERQERQGKQEK